MSDNDKMREFVAEVKQLCKDFSDQRDRPYMGDVHAALDGLYEQWQAAQAEQSKSVPVGIEHDGICIEADGCPTEKAVLQRFWRDAQQSVSVPVVVEYEPEKFRFWYEYEFDTKLDDVVKEDGSDSLLTGAMSLAFEAGYRTAAADAFKAGAAWQAAQAELDRQYSKLSAIIELHIGHEAWLMSLLGIGEVGTSEHYKYRGATCFPDREKILGFLDEQAAQAEQSVPVVGEVVAHQFYDHGKWHNFIDDRHYQNTVAAGYEVRALVSQPTHSIATAELERLRKDAERGRLLIDRGEWFRFDHDTPDAYALLAVRLPYDVDLSCKPTREDAIDAAIAAVGYE